MTPLAQVFEREKAGPWIEHAACLGMAGDLFFPGRGESTHEALAICRECPVRRECLDHAIANSEHWGIWGGMSERQRKRERQRRGQMRRRAA